MLIDAGDNTCQDRLLRLTAATTPSAPSHSIDGAWLPIEEVRAANGTASASATASRRPRRATTARSTEDRNPTAGATL